MNRTTPKSIKVFSIVIVALFILAQLMVTTIGDGAWCSPSLTAPHDEGHPFYQFTGYGFPFPFVTVTKQDCFQVQSTSYEWSPLGLGVDGLLLILVTAPLWVGFLRKNTKHDN